MSGNHDKIILKCLRCHQEHNTSVDDYARGKGGRRCPVCGGEMDCSAFGEWVKQQSEKNMKRLDEIRKLLSENSN
jgi:hypothetical protein